MIDLGISKLALIGAVALIVIGTEKLPRVARTGGALLGKAQRYVADVKAEEKLRASLPTSLCVIRAFCPSFTP